MPLCRRAAWQVIAQTESGHLTRSTVVLDTRPGPRSLLTAHCSLLTAHAHSRSLALLCCYFTVPCAAYCRSHSQAITIASSNISRNLILYTCCFSKWVAECFSRGCSEASPTVWDWSENRLLRYQITYQKLSPTLSIPILAPPTPPTSSDTCHLSLP